MEGEATRAKALEQLHPATRFRFPKCLTVLTYRSCRHACKRVHSAGARDTARNNKSVAVCMMC